MAIFFYFVGDNIGLPFSLTHFLEWMKSIAWVGGTGAIIFVIIIVILDFGSKIWNLIKNGG